MAQIIGYYKWHPDVVWELDLATAIQCNLAAMRQVALESATIWMAVADADGLQRMMGAGTEADTLADKYGAERAAEMEAINARAVEQARAARQRNG